MNGRIRGATVLVLSDDETRAWHSVFSRELREMRRNQILERCERLAREAGSARYAVFDAYESLVARGEVTPAA